MTSELDKLPLWCVLQADGDKAVPTTRGPVPIQYCRLGDSPMLIQNGMRRALYVTRPRHIVVTVAEPHRTWWVGPLSCVPPQRRVVDESSGRLTVTLAAALALVERETPDAIVVLQPADMSCESEHALVAGLQQAIRALQRLPAHIVALTIEPRIIEPGQDYLLLGPADGLPGRSAVRFVKRPEPVIADRLVAGGAQLNTGVYVARLATLTGTLSEVWPDLMGAARSLAGTAPGEVVTGARIPGSQFCRPWRHTWVQRPLPRLRAVSVNE
jgi:mannose-1-phosphate guanylyltransferase